MSLFLSIDPGLVVTGLALWRLPAGPAYMPDLPQLLVATGSLRSSTTDGDDAARQRAMLGQLRRWWAAAGPLRAPTDIVAHVVIEIPAIAGLYRQRRSRARTATMNAEDVQRNQRWAGVLAGYWMAVDATVGWVAADGQRKRQRVATLRAFGLDASNEHERDAVALGARVLTDWRRAIPMGAA